MDYCCRISLLLLSDVRRESAFKLTQLPPPPYFFSFAVLTICIRQDNELPIHNVDFFSLREDTTRLRDNIHNVDFFSLREDTTRLRGNMHKHLYNKY